MAVESAREVASCLCPALMIAAPSSGSGKTTITAAIAHYHYLQGKKVTVFKMGPDFIDPMILANASGAKVYQLDLWLVGEKGCRELLYQAALVSDLILIEGVMGLFDGTPSSADLAQLFKIPVLGVIDASAMAQTFSALAYGLANFRNSLIFAGVLANRVNSEGHAQMLQEDLPDDISFYGRIPKDQSISLAERHLGLVQAQELTDITKHLSISAEHISKTRLKNLPESVKFFSADQGQIEESHYWALRNTKVTIIKDVAFNFLYAANVDFLIQAGAQVSYCSALNDTELPEGDVLYIPGGYPELYAAQLSNNQVFIKSVQGFVRAGKKVIAECGGMLYLLDKLTDLEGTLHCMAGLLPGNARMQNKLAAIGSQSVDLSCLVEDKSCSGELLNEKPYKNNVIRGHSFHYSTAEINLTPLAQTLHHPSQRAGEFVYQHGNIIASYMHWYFPSNVKLAVKLFTK